MSLIHNQFGRPRGFMGNVAGWIMANRPSNRERNLWTVKLLQLEPHHRVLEIGFGPGFALEACVQALSAGHAVGLDHSATMAAQAKSRMGPAIAAGRVELLLGGLERLDQLEQASFDRILSVNVVQFLPDKAAAFGRLFAILKPHGVVATTYQPRNATPTRDDALRMADQLAGVMRDVGFIDLHTEELPLTPAPAMCVLGRRPLQSDPWRRITRRVG